MAENTSDET